MTLYELICKLHHDPDQFIDGSDAIYLGAFINGLQWVVPEVRALKLELRRRYSKIDTFDAFSHALLSGDGMKPTLNEMVRLGDSWSRLAIPSQPPKPFVDVIADESLGGGRTGMYMAESTVTYFDHHLRGERAALGIWFPEACDARSAQFETFTVWLAHRHGLPDASWARIVRVYGGACAEGLTYFAKHWTEWSARVVRPA